MIDAERNSTRPGHAAASGEDRLGDRCWQRAGAKRGATFCESRRPCRRQRHLCGGLAQTCALAAAEQVQLDACRVDASIQARWQIGSRQLRCGTAESTVLYNNGAAAQMAPFAQMSLEQWRDTLKGELDVGVPADPRGVAAPDRTRRWIDYQRGLGLRHARHRISWGGCACRGQSRRDRLHAPTGA